MKRTISKILSLVLSVALLCTVIPFSAFADVAVLTGQRIELTSPAAEVEAGTVVEIPATISNPEGIQGLMLEVTWDPTLLSADATFALGKYKCFSYPTANSDGVSIQDQTKTLTVDYVADGKLIYAAAAGYVFEDYTTPLSAGTFKFTVLEAAKGKDVVVTVSPVSVDANGNVNGGTYATDADMKNVAFDTPVNATIKVAGDEEPEINYYTVTYKVDGEVVKTFENVEEGTATPTYDYTAPEGYDFSGFGAIPETVTEDLTFEGTTTIKKFTVIYKVDGEVVDTFENVEYGAAVPASTYEVPEGYTFSGFGEIPATVTQDLVIEGTTEEIPVTPPVGGVPVLTGQRIELTSPAAEVEAGTVVEIPATISNPEGIQGLMLEVTWDPTLLSADATFALGKYKCFSYPTANSDGVSIQDQTKTLTVDYVADGKLIYAAAAGYVFEDYTTPLSAGTFKFTVLEAAKGKDVVVTVSPVSVDANGNVNGGTYATDADMKNVAFDTPVNATIKVAGEAEPETKYYTVTYKVNGEVVETFENVAEGSATPTFDYTAPEGYTFSGWGDIPATVTQDLVIEGTTAEIVIPKFTVVFQVGELVVGTIEKEEGESVEKAEYPAVEPKEGHSIVWDNEGPITESTTVYGTYVANSYTVTYKVDGEVVHTETVVYGAEIPAYEYEVADGYTFSGFGEIPATMPATDLVFEGTTEEIPVVTYEVKFIVFGDVVSTLIIEEGTAIGEALPENPEVATYIFNGWFDETGAAVTAETEINADMEVTADFTKDPMDVNGDDVIDSKDSIYLLNHCALPELYPVDEDLDFDFNKDGVVNSKDAVYHLGSLVFGELYSLR